MANSVDLKQNFGYNIGFSFMREKLFGTSHFSLGFGLGFSSYTYSNNLNITTDPATEQSVYQFLDNDTAYDQNKQVLQYLEVPIEFRFRSRSNRKGRYFRFYPFVKAGYQIRSYNHFVKGNYSVVDFNIRDLNRWRVLAGIRTGYWIFSFYASYELTPLYQEVVVGESDLSEWRTLNLGLSISF